MMYQWLTLSRRFLRNNYYLFQDFKLFWIFLNLQKEKNSVMEWQDEKKKKKSKGSVEKMTRRYWNINLKEMVEAGVHFGHGIKKWNPKMAPYISAKRKGTHIINLARTARFLSEACDLVFDAASQGKSFLIVGSEERRVGKEC